ncbi:hypothetical protein FB45DRAFT_1033466 [Roridomyces roridus]|uniref:Uncharacterized protein n=1 Tax=Roridomyces roridus TaxID=1738132 RepID=A0AAD7FHV7_9AGAR|nr:hypothetical protein FB45DRAFT_1033466 [Roridomyces roridus]
MNPDEMNPDYDDEDIACAVEDVVSLLGDKTAQFAGFPVDPTQLQLQHGGISDLVGNAMLRRIISRKLPGYFMTRRAVWERVRDVLTSDAVSAAVVDRLGWKVPSDLEKAQFFFLVVLTCDDEPDLEPVLCEWAEEFYRSLAIIARDTLYPNDSWVKQASDYAVDAEKLAALESVKAYFEVYKATGRPPSPNPNWRDLMPSLFDERTPMDEISNDSQRPIRPLLKRAR